MTFLWTETLTPLAYQLRRWHTSGHASGHAHCPVPSAHPDAGQVDYFAQCSLRARFPNLDAFECPAQPSAPFQRQMSARALLAHRLDRFSASLRK